MRDSPLPAVEMLACENVDGEEVFPLEYDARRLRTRASRVWTRDGGVDDEVQDYC